ncbi:hypothetical protein BDV34DRAFT_221506 [Aspergillus parasiticus]|uniref:Uncharacterized protein n=1 Tax=Aspergillus parasiticus TaxID=5067 RepID=A0A5N6DXD7_ASPPA|nr:hypothetical protein BDV34DRAFT_221506 [Aspergillus parasiticus]
MARLLVIVLFYLAALAAGQHIHTHEERGRPMFWSKEELHSLCQNVVVSEQRPRQGKPQTFLRASCKTKRQARASEPWVTSIINLDQCLGWDERQQNFTSKAGYVYNLAMAYYAFLLDMGNDYEHSGMGIEKGDCHGRRYYDYRQLFDPITRSFQCWCGNVGGGEGVAMLESPDSLTPSVLANFDMDGVIGAVNAVVYLYKYGLLR